MRRRVRSRPPRVRGRARGRRARRTARPPGPPCRPAARQRASRGRPCAPRRRRSGWPGARDGSRGTPSRPRAAPSASGSGGGTAWRRWARRSSQARFARVPGPLLVVDAPSMLFRAFYALPDTITGSDGQPVNALLGTANLILREIEEHGPRAVVLCFGPDAADYRVELFDGYHAERPDVPDLLAPQFLDARPFFEAFDWIVADSDSFEADDLLGSYANRETEAGGRTLVMTGDRDMFQCAGAKVQILYVRTGGKQGAELVDAAEVKRRYGVPPELVPDFIAL